jgi:hypothetical protein
MNLFGNKKVMVVYSCARGKGSRATYLESQLTYNYLLGLRSLVQSCEKEDGVCPDRCEIKKLFDQYGGTSNLEVK